MKNINGIIENDNLLVSTEAFTQAIAYGFSQILNHFAGSLAQISTKQDEIIEMVTKNQKEIEPEEKEWLTIPQVAEMFDTTAGAIRAKVFRKAIPSTKIGGSVRINRKELMEYVACNKRLSGSQIEAEAMKIIEGLK